MWINEQRPRPRPWREYRAARPRWIVPLLYGEWCTQWAAHLLSNWTFLEVLEYFGRFSVLLAVIFYFLEAPDRRMQKHYQAWQVINTAQGKSGSGGRIEALQELDQDGVSLVAVDVSKAALQGVQLDAANLVRGNFAAADLRDASFRKANLWLADFTDANLERADLTGANLRSATLGPLNEDQSGEQVVDAGADLQNATLSQCDLDGAALAGADLRFVDLAGAKWQNMRNIRLADIFGIRNADPAFRAWAMAHGAVEAESDDDWRKAWMGGGGNRAGKMRPFGAPHVHAVLRDHHR